MISRAFQSHSEYFLATTSGILLGVSATIPNAGICAVAGLAVLFFCLLNKEHSRKKLLFLALLSGCIYMAFGYAPILSLYPLTWSGIYSVYAGRMLVVAVWAVTVFSQAVVIGVWAVSCHRFFKEKNVIAGFYVAAIWVLSEKLRAFLFSLLFFSPVSKIQSHFDFHSVGLITADLKVDAWMLPFGGVALGSFVMVWVAFAISYLFIRKQYGGLVIVGVFALFSFLLPPVHAPAAGTSVVVQVVTSNFPVDFSPQGIVSRVAAIESLLREKEKKDSILVLPENSYYLASEVYGPNADGSKVFLNKLIIDSSPAEGGHRLYYFKPSTKETEAHEKILLMPQGEYAVSIGVLLARLFELDSWLYYNESKIYPETGNTVEPYVFDTDTTVGGLLCSEITSPYLLRELVRKGATFLVIPSSQAVFHRSRILRNQTYMTARVRAIEMNRYVVISANATDSLVFTNQGDILVRIGPFASAELTDAVVVNNIHLTPYVRFGEWPVYMSVGIMLLAILRRTSRHLSQKYKE